MSRGYVLAALFLVFAALAVALHYQGFSAPFYFDSNHHFVERKPVYASNSLLHVVKTFPSRAVSMATFYIGYSAHGMEPYYFRLANAVLLAATGVAIFVLLSVMLDIPALELHLTVEEKTLVSLACALMFVVHTVQVLAVLYVVQRMALMSCFFYVCCLTCYFATRMGRVRFPLLGYLLCGALFLLALFSKENAVTIPVALFLAEFAFFSRDTRLSLKILALCLVPVIVLGLMLVLIQTIFKFEGTTGALGYVSSDYHWTGYGLHEVIMTQSRILFGYLAIIAAPFIAHVALLKPVVVSKGLFDPPVTAVAVVGLMALIVAGFIGLRNRPLAGFGIVAYVLMLAPEGVLDPKVLCSPYRAVLPTVAFLMVLADLAAGILDWGRTHGRQTVTGLCVGGFACIWVVLTAATTVSMARVWHNPVLMWSDVVDGFLPEDTDNIEKFSTILGLNSLAEALQRSGNVSAAMSIHERVLKVQPNSVETLNNMGNIMLSQGRTDDAIRYLRRAIEIKPRARQPRVNLGAALMTRGKVAEAEEQFQKAVDLYPQNAIARLNLGIALIQLGRYEDAAAHLSKAVEYGPRMAAARNNLGRVYQMKGDLSEAARQFTAALTIDPNLIDAHCNLADTMLRTGNYEQAARHFSMAAERAPNDFDVQKGLGEAYLKLSRFRDAMEHFRAALSIRPDAQDVKDNLDRASKGAEARKP